MPTIGEILRSEREKKGLSIKDIEKATSIRALYLEAIEDDNYSVIPGEVYVKGFIRNYANYMGLDAQQIINLYRQSKNHANIENTTPTESVREKPESSQSTSETKKTKWVVIGLVGVVLLGSLWWVVGNHNNKSQQLPETKPSPVSPAVPVPSPTPATPAVDKPAAQANPVVVIAKYTDSCWTLVTVDGKEVYEGIPKVGETLTWEGKKDISIQLGNADGVEVTYNGQSLGKMGGKGEVLKKTFSGTNPKQ